MEMCTFKLTDFEGPLDLLLTLVQKNKMNIYDIKITQLINQYLVIMEANEEQIDETSAFVEIAARFVYMKSVFLLPKTEESERLKEELTGMLIEYSLCKEIAAKLKNLAEGLDLYIRDPMEVTFDTAYNVKHDAFLLPDAYAYLAGRKLMRRTLQTEQFDELVTAPVVSVASKIIYVIRNIVQGKVSSFKQLFSGSRSKSDAVATFLAVLELIKAGRLTIDKEENVKVNKVAKKGV